MGLTDMENSTPTNRFIVKKANTKKEMDSIMDVIWAANYTPYDPIIQLFFPILGFWASDREAAIAESKERFWQYQQTDASCNWFYVEDNATGNTVGCAQWHVSPKHPFPDGPSRLQAPWWPQGEYRDFCEHILTQAYYPRSSWMTRQHVALNWMAVLPSYRRLGVGTLLMHVGLSLADQHGIEAWMEASSMGKPLYENHGFRAVFMITFDTKRTDPSDVWRKCEHEMTPSSIFAMWRPKQGEWSEEGSSIKMPWELGIE